MSIECFPANGICLLVQRHELPVSMKIYFSGCSHKKGEIFLKKLARLSLFVDDGVYHRNGFK